MEGHCLESCRESEDLEGAKRVPECVSLDVSRRPSRNVAGLAAVFTNGQTWGPEQAVLNLPAAAPHSIHGRRPEPSLVD